jgi:purine nucleoside phosphorylase
MLVGVITGSGTYALEDLEGARPEQADTPYGSVAMTRGHMGEVEVLHVSRHGEGHPRLSNHVNHRANVWALKHAGASCVVGATACGAVDPQVELGSIVLFDDLHFPVNRLPDGSIATFFDQAGGEGRGHWIYEGPFSEPLRMALVEGAASAGVAAHDGGCYGHVDGPRFNTATEIAALAGLGVTAVSQTAGPETVLAGELELPYALMGFATDYANGVQSQATPVEELIRLMGESTARFAAVLARALPGLVGVDVPPVGVVYRFG